jgi:hypothetical protein
VRAFTSALGGTVYSSAVGSQQRAKGNPADERYTARGMRLAHLIFHFSFSIFHFSLVLDRELSLQ